MSDRNITLKWRIICNTLLGISMSAACALAFVLCSCTRTVYEPVESVRTEYVAADTTAIYNRVLEMMERRNQSVAASDSVVDRQKVTVVINERGDTMRHDSERVLLKSSKRERELESQLKENNSLVASLRQQLIAAKVDSISVPYPVERRLTRWERAKMDFGGIALGSLVAVICIATIWLVRRFCK